MKKIQIILIPFIGILIVMMGCQKMDRPPLGDYPKDTNPPGGPLKFYVAFDGTTTDALRNAVDSTRANFPTDNPFVSTDGVTGKGVQGDGTTAIKYANANDFAASTSCTIAMWINNVVNPNTELYFSLADTKDYWHSSAAFLLVEHAAADKCQLKFALMDHWVEYLDNFNKPLFDGQWHHLAFTYDETTSKLLVYFDGQNVPTPGTSGDFTANGQPLGPLNLINSTNLIVGGWNKQAGVTGPTDDWIKGFSGKMDQFRLYGKALSASEVLALYNSKE